jgi:hypothetical protein
MGALLVPSETEDLLHACDSVERTTCSAREAMSLKSFECDSLLRTYKVCCARLGLEFGWCGMSSCIEASHSVELTKIVDQLSKLQGRADKLASMPPVAAR